MAGTAAAAGKGLGGKKIMGLPAPVLLGVLGAALVVGLWLRSRGKSSTSVTDPGSISQGAAGGGLSPATSAGTDPALLAAIQGGYDEIASSISNQNTSDLFLQSLEAFIAGLPVYNVGSSGGSGASSSGKHPKQSQATSTKAPKPNKSDAATSTATATGSDLPVGWTATPVVPLVPGGGGKLVAP